MEQISNKLSGDPFLVKEYKNLNYLIKNINNEQNCVAKIIYLDNYLNITSPKCIIGQKIGELNIKIEKVMAESQKQKNINKALIKVFSEKFPE